MKINNTQTFKIVSWRHEHVLISSVKDSFKIALVAICSSEGIKYRLENYGNTSFFDDWENAITAYYLSVKGEEQ